MPVGINLGQVCVELAPAVEEVSAREEDMSLGNTPDTGRADHHPFQIKALGVMQLPADKSVFPLHLMMLRPSVRWEVILILDYLKCIYCRILVNHC